MRVAVRMTDGSRCQDSFDTGQTLADVFALAKVSRLDLWWREGEVERDCRGMSPSGFEVSSSTQQKPTGPQITLSHRRALEDQVYW